MEISDDEFDKFQPNNKALQLSESLKTQMNSDLIVNCSNDENAIFFTFEEQKDQSARYLLKQPAIFVENYQTRTSGLNYLVLIG